MNRLIAYGLILTASALTTIAFADMVGELVIEMFEKVLNNFPR